MIGIDRLDIRRLILYPLSQRGGSAFSTVDRGVPIAARLVCQFPRKDRLGVLVSRDDGIDVSLVTVHNARVRVEYVVISTVAGDLSVVKVHGSVALPVVRERNDPEMDASQNPENTSRYNLQLDIVFLCHLDDLIEALQSIASSVEVPRSVDPQLVGREVGIERLGQGGFDHIEAPNTKDLVSELLQTLEDGFDIVRNLTDPITLQRPSDIWSAMCQFSGACDRVLTLLPEK